MASSTDEQPALTFNNSRLHPLQRISIQSKDTLPMNQPKVTRFQKCALLAQADAALRAACYFDLR